MKPLFHLPTPKPTSLRKIFVPLQHFPIGATLLIPRTAAYATRVQIDSQSRLMAKMGALNYAYVLLSKDGILHSTGKMLRSNGLFGKGEQEWVCWPSSWPPTRSAS